MSISKLNSDALYFYNIDGNTVTTKIKFIPNENELVVQGESNTTKVKITNIEDPNNNSDVSTKNYVDTQITSRLNDNFTNITVDNTVSSKNFISPGSSGDSSDVYSIPKMKSLSIHFSTVQTIIGNDTFVTIGSDSQLSGIFFSYDENITMAFVMSTFKILHNGTNGSSIFPNYEIAYYNEFQNQQSYEGVSGMFNDFQLYSEEDTEYQIPHQSILGDGINRIASIRIRIKHDNNSDSLSIKDSLQMTAFAISESLGHLHRTFNNGLIE